MKVFNADTTPMTTHVAQLSITASTCPDSLLLDAMNQPVLADFDLDNPGVTDSTSILSGESETAVVLVDHVDVDKTLLRSAW